MNITDKIEELIRLDGLVKQKIKRRRFVERIVVVEAIGVIAVFWFGWWLFYTRGSQNWWSFPLVLTCIFTAVWRIISAFDWFKESSGLDSEIELFKEQRDRLERNVIRHIKEALDAHQKTDVPRAQISS